jgi:hypothetical protein
LDSAELQNPGSMTKVRFELDPQEADAFVCGMPPRQEFVYRLALRGLCARCRRDPAFTRRTNDRRTNELIAQFDTDLPAVRTEANKLGEEIAASVAAR